MNYTVIGIDPGRKGGLVAMDLNRRILLMQPLDDLSEEGLYSLITSLAMRLPGIRVAYKELYIRAFSAANAAYEMGRQHAVIDLAARQSGLTLLSVRAVDWQRRILLKGTEKLKTKEAALITATELLPGANFQRKLKGGKESKQHHDGLVDAALIALFGVSEILERQLAQVTS